MGATPNSTNDNSEVYEDTYDIPLLSTSDDGRVIECEIIILTTLSVMVTSDVTLDVNGKYTSIVNCYLICCSMKLILNDKSTLFSC